MDHNKNAVTLILDQNGVKTFHQFFLVPQNEEEKEPFERLLDKALQDIKNLV